MSRLLDQYNNQIKLDLKNKLNIKNLYAVPKIEKIVINMGIGEGKEDSKLIDKALEDLSLIAGQKAIKTKSKKKTTKNPTSLEKNSAASNSRSTIYKLTMTNSPDLYKLSKIKSEILLEISLI